LDCDAWDDEDFEEEEEEEAEPDEVEAAVKEATERAAVIARVQAEQKIKARELAKKREQDREALRKWSEQHPDQDEAFIDEHGMVAHRPRKPPVSTTLEQARADVAKVAHQFVSSGSVPKS
jgi:hypothetical protein